MRVNREEAASFMHEYRESSNKEQFISDKQKQCRIVFQVGRIFPFVHLPDWLSSARQKVRNLAGTEGHRTQER